jgi:hypothetical protein
LIVLTINTPRNVAKGHTPHRGGGGQHKHRNAARLGTRSARTRQAMTD